MKKLATLLLIFFLFACSGQDAQAQDVSLGSAIPVELTESGVLDGDIISSKEGGGYSRSVTPYDPFLFGVISLDPAVSLYDKDAENEVPAIIAGKVYVRVSTAQGAIERGYPITSSTNPGVGVRATENGYIIGYAQEAYTASDPSQIGKILVNLQPHFAQMDTNIFTALFSLPRLSFAATPLNTTRYLLAGLVGVFSFISAFDFFGRASLEGVGAMGRNPLAKREIILIVVVNAALTIGVMLVGFAVAYLILVI